MAFTQNSSVDYSDLSSYYTSFNTFIARCGGSITQLTIPTQGKIVPSDITNLNAKINEFQSEEYLRQESSLWIPAPAPNVGDLLQASNWTNITTTINNFSIIKCRNLASNTQGTQTCAPQRCDSEGTCKTKSCSSQGSCSPKACSSEGTCGKTCTQGTCNYLTFSYIMGNSVNSSFSSGIKGLYVTNDRAVASRYTNGSCGNLCGYSGPGGSYNCPVYSCSVSCTSFSAISMGNNSPYPKQGTCSVTCAYSSNGVSCGYGTNGNINCNNGSNGNDDCTYGTNGNDNCTHGTKTCTAKGTTYDLRNTKTTMTKT